MAQLPDFQMTPASSKALQDLHLGARARLALARDKRTHPAAVKVRADSGVVTVSYRPQDQVLARDIPSVLETVGGIRDLRITMATANLLWIHEVERGGGAPSPGAGRGAAAGGRRGPGRSGLPRRPDPGLQSPGP
jgi:hypothetical protein